MKRCAVRAILVGTAVTIVAWVGAWSYTNRDEFRARRLVRELARRPPSSAEKWLVRLGLVGPREERETVEMLRELVPMGQTAARAALHEFQRIDNGVVWQVLSEVGPPAIAAIVDGLDSSDPAIRRISIRACEHLPDIAYAMNVMTEENLVRRRGDDDLEECDRILSQAIRKVGPILIRALHDTEPMNRACAAESLGTMPEIAADSIPALMQCFDDQQDFVRESAVHAVGCLVGHEEYPANTPLVWATLTEALGRARAYVRSAAAGSLPNFFFWAGQSEEIIEILEGLARDDPDESVRKAAAEALSWVHHYRRQSAEIRATRAGN